MTPLQTYITQHLEEKNLSVNGLERLAGLKSNAVYNILSGNSKNPKLETLQAIANAFQCSVQDLISGDNKGTSSARSSVQKKEKPDHIWDRNLYMDATEALVTCLEKRKETILSKQAHHLVLEIYLYALLSETKQIDTRFVEWIVGKTL